MPKFSSETLAQRCRDTFFKSFDLKYLLRALKQITFSAFDQNGDLKEGKTECGEHKKLVSGKDAGEMSGGCWI